MTINRRNYRPLICRLLSSSRKLVATQNDPNVLLVFYEDLKECYETSVRSVAEFMDITDEDCIQVA